MEELRVVNKDNMAITKTLWEQAFKDQPGDFVSYYYKNRAKDNTAYIISDDEDVHAMIQIAPYRFQIQGSRICESDYIVGVAEMTEHKGRGLIDKLLSAAVKDLNANETPFVFLRSEEGEKYESCGFRYVYDRVDWKLNEAMVVPQMLRYVSALNLYTGFWPHQYADLRIAVCHSAHMEELALFVNNKLSMSSDVFTYRDADYFEKLKDEMRSRGGNLFKFVDDGKLIGYFASTMEEVPQIREAVVTPELLQLNLLERTAERIPCVTTRIVYLPKMLELIHLKNQYDGETIVTLKITDSIIEDNNGVFELRCDSAKTELRRTGEKAEVSADIGDLAAFLFGYREAADCFTFESDEAKNKFLEKINRFAVLHGTHLSEQV